MLIRLKPLSLALSGAALLTLAACGGGGDSAVEVLEPVPAPTTNVPVKVIDGAIKNALVCLDKNANNACDACLLYTSPSPRDRTRSRMPSSA